MGSGNHSNIVSLAIIHLTHIKSEYRTRTLEQHAAGRIGLIGHHYVAQDIGGIQHSATGVRCARSGVMAAKVELQRGNIACVGNASAYIRKE